jgi:hypothetical protein
MAKNKTIEKYALRIAQSLLDTYGEKQVSELVPIQNKTNPEKLTHEQKMSFWAMEFSEKYRLLLSLTVELLLEFSLDNPEKAIGYTEKIQKIVRAKDLTLILENKKEIHQVDVNNEIVPTILTTEAEKKE